MTSDQILAMILDLYTGLQNTRAELVEMTKQRDRLQTELPASSQPTPDPPS